MEIKNKVLIFMLMPLLAGTPCHGQPADDLKDLLSAFHKIRDGVPPESNLRLIDEKRREAMTHLSTLRAALHDSPTQQFSEACVRFQSNTQNINAQAQALLEFYGHGPAAADMQSDASLLRGVRTQILLSALAEMAFLIEVKAEGGFNILLPQERLVCPFNKRTQIKQLLLDTVNSLSEFFPAAFGTQSLAGMDQVENRLLTIAANREDQASRNDRVVFAATTALSLLLWEAAPVASAAFIRTVWGQTPRLLTLPGIKYAIRTSVLGVEGLAINSLLSSNDSEEVRALTLEDWNEHMNTVEALLKSPMESPELALALIHRIHAQAFSDEIPWLEMLAQQLKDSTEARSVTSSLYVLNEMKATAGDNVVLTQTKLQRELSAWFNFSTSCDSSIVRGISDVKCLLGLRSLARALYGLNPAHSENNIAVQVSGPGNWRAPDSSRMDIVFTAPYNGTTSDMASFIGAQMQSPGFIAQSRLLRQIRALTQQLEAQTKRKIILDPDLSLHDAFSGLSNGLRLATQAQSPFDGEVEQFKLSTYFRAPYEAGDKIMLNLEASATAQDMASFLLRNHAPKQIESHGWPAPLTRFEQLRVQLSALQTHMIADGTVDTIECRYSSGLTLEDCYTALGKIDTFWKSGFAGATHFDRLVVASAQELPKEAFYFVDLDSQKTALFVAQSLTYDSLLSLYSANGWR